MAAQRKEGERKSLFPRLKKGESATAPVVLLESPGTPPREINYKYLEKTDLTPKMMAETDKTYGDFPEEYSKYEYQIKTISDVWEYVIKENLPTLQSLPENAKVAILGGGTGMQRIMLALLRGDIEIYTSDINAEMKRVAEQQLTWENIEALAKFIKDSLGENNWMIHGLLEIMSKINLIFRVPKEAQRYFKTDNMLADIVGKTSFVEKDIRALDYPDEMFDMAFAVAVLPHVEKDKVFTSIDCILRTLKPGSTLVFNLRADLIRWSENKKGRVFWDDVIGGRRFFNTYTQGEVDELVAKLRAIYPGLEIRQNENINPHFDKHKPEFINFRVTKTKKPIPIRTSSIQR